MGLAHRNVIAGFLLPVLAKRLIVLLLEFAGRIIGNIKQLYILSHHTSRHQH